MFKISNLAYEVKFDLGGQSSFWSKVEYLTKGLCRKEIVYLALTIKLKMSSIEVPYLQSYLQSYIIKKELCTKIQKLRNHQNYTNGAAMQLCLWTIDKE